MGEYLALCIEDLDADNPNERYVQCVAVPGRAPGLRLDPRGQPLWRVEQGAVCELWRSADGRLVLWKLEGTEPIVVTRARRSVEVPVGKPVMLLDKDGIDIGGRHLRVHLHGTTVQEHAPRPLVTGRPRPVFRTAASAVVLGATLVATTAGSAQEAPPIEVREHPPAPLPPPPPPDAGPEPDAAGSGSIMVEDDRASGEESVAGTEPIEVRDTPPAPPPPPPPAGGCCSRQPGT